MLALGHRGRYTGEQGKVSIRQVVWGVSALSEPFSFWQRVRSMPQETSPKLRRVVALSHRMLLGALLCFALWGSSPSAVYATTPVAAPSEPALTQGMPGEGAAMAEPPGLGLYLMALGVALLMMGFYVLQRARQRRLLDFEVMPDEPLPLAPTQLLTPKHDELTALVQAVARRRAGRDQAP